MFTLYVCYVTCRNWPKTVWDSTCVQVHVYTFTCPAVPATTNLLLYLHRLIFWIPSLGSSLYGSKQPTCTYTFIHLYVYRWTRKKHYTVTHKTCVSNATLLINLNANWRWTIVFDADHFQNAFLRLSFFLCSLYKTGQSSFLHRAKHAFICLSHRKEEFQ